MIRRTETARTLALVLALLVGLVAHTFVSGAEIDGKWHFEKTITYVKHRSLEESPPFDELAIQDGEVTFSLSCSVDFVPQDYFFSEVFQGLAKEGEDPSALDKFLRKNLDFSISHTKKSYTLSIQKRKCARPAVFFFYTGKRIIFPVGEIFYSYVKSGRAVSSAQAMQAGLTGELVKNYKKTPLPFDFYQYFSACRPKILAAKRGPQTTTNCAPEYYPYVADPNSNDTLMKLIGNHDYVKGGSESAYEFSPPFQEKRAATFLVFAPMLQVVLVRVDDFEIVQNEDRTIMTGVYLSIKDNKVVDQISGCTFDPTYTCSEDGRPVARLTASGKFQQL